MAAERFFTKVTNDVLTATEQIAARMEEGLSIVFQGSTNGQDNEKLHQSENVVYEDEQDVEDILRESPLQGMADGVLKDIMGSQHTPTTPIEHFHAFRSAVTWTEPFILGLVTFQIIVFALSVYASRKDCGLVFRLSIMIFIAMTVKGSEYVNSLASTHWDTFSTQNYFDERGLFMAVMVCTPLLLDSLFMLFMFTREASQLLVQVKSRQIRGRMKEEAKESKSDKRTKRTKKE